MIGDEQPDDDMCLAEQLAVHEWWQVRKAEVRTAVARLVRAVERREPYDPPVRELLTAQDAARLRAVLEEAKQ